MNRILNKVVEGMLYAENSTEGIYVIDKKKLRVKIQYNKLKGECYFTVHELKKDGKHNSTFKSWHWKKYKYDTKTHDYTLIREGKYVWNPKK